MTDAHPCSMTRLTALLLTLASSVALAQATGPAKAPSASKKADEATQIAQLKQRVQQLESQVADQNDALQSLDQQLQDTTDQAQATEEALTQLNDRGASLEAARQARIQALDTVAYQASQIDYLLTLGTTGLDPYLAALQSTLEAVQQSADATSGRLELGRETAALQALEQARDALAADDYYSAREALDAMVAYDRAARQAAAANPMRVWTRQPSALPPTSGGQGY